MTPRSVTLTVAGSEALVPITIYVDSSHMCMLTGEDSSSSLTAASSTAPALYQRDVVNLIDTASTPEVQGYDWDVLGVIFSNIASSSGDPAQLTTSDGTNHWAWTDKMFYMGLPREWYPTACYNPHPHFDPHAMKPIQ